MAARKPSEGPDKSSVEDWLSSKLEFELEEEPTVLPGAAPKKAKAVGAAPAEGDKNKPTSKPQERTTKSSPGPRPARPSPVRSRALAPARARKRAPRKGEAGSDSPARSSSRRPTAADARLDEPDLPWPDWQPDPLPEFEEPLTGPGTDGGTDGGAHAGVPSSRASGTALRRGAAHEATPAATGRGRSARAPVAGDLTAELLKGGDTRPVPAPLPVDTGPGMSSWDDDESENTMALLADTTNERAAPRSHGPDDAPEDRHTRELPSHEDDERTAGESSVAARALAAPAVRTSDAPSPESRPSPPTEPRPRPQTWAADEEDVFDAPTVFTSGSGAEHMLSLDEPTPAAVSRRGPPGTASRRSSAALPPTPEVAPRRVAPVPSPASWGTHEDVHDAPTIAANDLDVHQMLMHDADNFGSATPSGDRPTVVLPEADTAVAAVPHGHGMIDAGAPTAVEGFEAPSAPDSFLFPDGADATTRSPKRASAASEPPADPIHKGPQVTDAMLVWTGAGAFALMLVLGVLAAGAVIFVAFNF